MKILVLLFGITELVREALCWTSRIGKYQSRSRRTKPVLGLTPGHKVADQSLLPDLPIFPLRKRCLLPTEHITLNLYEERYLRMAESILFETTTTDRKGVFGAFFANQKPQILFAGTGPIVPLLEPGDRGVVCVVTESKENMVPTRDGVTTRRRIRLVGTAVAVCQVQRVLSNGYNGTTPYIVSCVNLVDSESCDDQPTVDGIKVGKSLDGVESKWAAVAKSLVDSCFKQKDDVMYQKILKNLCRYEALAADNAEAGSMDRLRLLEESTHTGF